MKYPSGCAPQMILSVLQALRLPQECAQAPAGEQQGEAGTELRRHRRPPAERLQYCLHLFMLHTCPSQSL